MTIPVRGLATLSIDLDNAWAYRKTAGQPGWGDFPSYLEILVPRVLSVLHQHELRITWFIVGQDAAMEKNLAALSLISPAGHEVGNHSFHHEPWVKFDRVADAATDLSLADGAIMKATGQKPRGYRSPGHAVSPAELGALAAAGYDYDASNLPTFVGPVARAYYFRTLQMRKEVRMKRSALFGRFGDVLQPLKPYLWQLNDARLLELPVTTMPLIRTPIHFSYLLSLAVHAPYAARKYFLLAMLLCKRLGVAPSLLLHSLDFLGRDDLEGFEFFPGMRQSSRDKLAFINWSLQQVSRRFDIVPIGRFAELLRSSGHLLPLRFPARKPVQMTEKKTSGANTADHDG